MTTKQKALATLGVLLLAEAFLNGIISRTAKTAGVSSAMLAAGGLVAGVIVTAL